MPNIELDDPQLKAIEEMKNGCILRGGVGSGKSRTAIAYFFLKVCEGGLRINGVGDMQAMRTPKDIYIITTAKKRDDLDWEKEAVAFGLSTHWEATFNGAQVFVDSWNNIQKYEGIKNAFFIFDEQRLVGSGAWVKAFIKIAKLNEWIMLSATPGDNWMDYVPVFIANGFYKNRTEFIRRHVVYNNFSKFPKVDHYVETGILNRHRLDVSVDLPYRKLTTRHIHEVIIQHNELIFKKVFKDRWNIYEDRPIKDVAEWFRVMRKLVNSDPSRLNQIKALLEKHPRLIIFYNFDYELELLRSLGSPLPKHGKTTGEHQIAPETCMNDSMSSGIEKLYVSEWNGHKHEEVPTSDRWVYLVQYTAGAEGWNCITTDATVFYSLNYSYKINEQAKGRIDRRNTKHKDLHYYILRSNSYIDNQILKSLRHKTNFNEKDAWNAQSNSGYQREQKSAA